MGPLSIRGRRAISVAAGAIIVVAAALTEAQGPGVEHLVFEGRTYELDGYEVLFDASTERGIMRRTLFTDYVYSSAEGEERRRLSNPQDPPTIWRNLATTEKATFVAITAALYCIRVNGQVRMLEWVTGVDEIHGAISMDGQVFKGNEAFRLWARLTKSALIILREEESRELTSFFNVCTNEIHEFGGDGSKHPDFCNTGSDFTYQAKINDSGGGFRGIQFNFNDRCADCGDIDVDYSVNCHLFPGNSKRA